VTEGSISRGFGASWHYLVRPTLRAAYNAARQEFAFRYRLAARASHGPSVIVDFPAIGRYILSSERGLYHVSSNTVRELCRIPAFGMAITGDKIYLATWSGDASIVLEGSLAALLDGGGCGWRELYRVRYLTEAGRIHQISVNGDALWLANTARNTYTKIDRHSGAWRANVGPFRCSFGHPILNDHNHVNSVFAQPEYLLFAAFKINRASALGLCGDGVVQIFSYPNMGVHDCIVTGDDVLFSDSYRFWDGGNGGVLIKNGRVFDQAYFDANPAFFVRGIAGERDEMLIGNSHVGDARERFKGQGALMLAQGDRVTHRVPLPLAQVYDILREDGNHFDRAPSARSFTAASALLRAYLGPPIEEFPLREVLSGEQQKKFAENDIGDIAEYLESRAPADAA
jgi:hypothetical protein